MSSHLPTVAVIGAGSSGITALKGLVEQGIDATCFEASDRVGGNWVFENKNGMSACYRDLHINTSRLRMAYSDYPMPEDYPDYPRHDQIAAYFDAYVDHFGLRGRIRFETRIERAERADDGTWELTLGDGSVERFDALVVANGHHWDPRMPEPAFPGSDSFEGVQMHSHAYMNPDFLSGKTRRRARHGQQRDGHRRRGLVRDRRGLPRRAPRGVHRPEVHLRQADRPARRLANPRIPFKIRQKMVAKLIDAYVGQVESFGLPKPDHAFGEAHPTVSGRILDRITHGAITPKPNIRELDGHDVVFEDGTRVRADVVIYCTGYKITFPFFDDDLLAAPDNQISLFRRVFHPDLPNVFFVGLLQPLGAMMPIAEAQGSWVASYLKGEYALPPRSQLLRDIAEDTAAMRSRYVASKRHTIQVDFDDYLFDTDRERRRGAQRARAAGFALPVPPRAGAAVSAMVAV